MVEYDIVYVEWEDPGQFHGWTSKLAEACAKIRTVGFLIKSTEKGHTIVESIGDDTEDPYGCSTFIPSHLIIKLEVLEIPDGCTR